MGWLVPAQVAQTVGGLLLFAVFGYLYASRRDSHLALWAAAWAAYTLRSALEVGSSLAEGGPWALLYGAAQVANVVSGLLLLIGTLRFLGARESRVWHLAAGAASVWAVAAVASGASTFAISVPGFLYLGVASIVTGVVWLRRSITRWGRVAGWIFVAWGIHRLDYPLLRGVEWFAPIGYMAGAAFAHLVAFCVLIAYLDRDRDSLAESEERYRELFDRSKSVMLLIDPESARIVDANDAAVRYYGWPREELTAMSITDINTLSAEEVRAEMGRAAEESRDHFLFCHNRAGGVASDVEVYSGPVTVGGRTMLYSIVHDITERREAERELARHKEHLEELVAERTAELRETNERLEAATRAKDVFLANMSHELRTPLNSIIGFSGILEQQLVGPLSEEQLRQVSMIRSSGDHLLSLVNDLLDLSAIDAGRTRPAPEAVDLTAALRASVAAIAPLCERSGLSLDVELPADPVVFRSDRRFIDQIMWNLLGNAVKFTAEGGVAVTLLARGGVASIEVCDTGPGIPPRERERVFDDFVQLSALNVAKSEGTGLGLSISRRLARMLGGDLVCGEPRDGAAGARFVLTLRDLGEE